MSSECPICYEEFVGSNNRVITECGHEFHTSCLMRNAAHNGFNCPCCRGVMADEPDLDEEDDYSTDDDYSIEEDDYSDDDYALRGFRFFFNLHEGTENDQLDVIEEFQQQAVPVTPSVNYILKKLQEEGVTMSQLVTALLVEQVEYEDNDNVCETADTIHDQFHRIISNWSLEKEEEKEEKEETEVIQVLPPIVESSIKEISFESDSKPSSKSRGNRELEEIRYIC